MLPGHEIDYEALIDRSIKDFQPAKRLWPVGARLLCWILLEAAILGLTAWIRGGDGLAALIYNSRHLFATGLFLSASIAAAFLALSSAIPGHEIARAQLAPVVAAICAGFIIGPESRGISSTPQLLALAAIPWLALFWAVRRAVPLQPEKTGALIGLAASCFAIALHPLISQPGEFRSSTIWLILSGILITVSSTLAGRLWLDWIRRWQQEPIVGEDRPIKWISLNAQTIFPVALTASIVALIFVLKGPGQRFLHVPDFDLAIESYERALISFSPNVPSTSIDAVLTAYSGCGMPVPTPMWNFGPQGFKLIGGRCDPLPDGTPLTYTWFRGEKAGVMCMIRQTEFNPPPIAHDEHRDLLFYRYRGFSVCLIKVGYGNFIYVIAAPMPLKQFEHLVLAASP